jgi:hypothetical protein
VRQVHLPWAEPKSRHTKAFERFAIDVMKETDVKGAANILRCSWDEAWGIMERAMHRGLERKEHRLPALVGVDEKAIRKGQRYLTLVHSIEGGTVEYIADERTQASLDGYFQSFSDKERQGVRAVVMDMWDPYINSVKAYLDDPEQKIVFDKFHIIKHMLRPGSWTSPAGGSPVRVIAGEPGSRPQLVAERRRAERGVKSLFGGSKRAGRRSTRAESCSLVTFTTGEPSRSCHGEGPCPTD